MRKKNKLLDKLDHPSYTNIVTPMGSVFDHIDPK